MHARILTPELMDEPGLDPAAHAQALAGLRRLNALSNAAGPVRSASLALLRKRGLPRDRASVLDIATGSGDLLIALARAGIGSAATGTRVGVDISQTALNVAEQQARQRDIAARWLLADVLTERLPLADQSVDIVVCSLFLHHLEGAGVVRVLAEMARVARVGIVISDLRRSRLGLVLAALASRTVTRSPIVHADALKSVRAAWTAEELASLASDAGLADARIERIWPARLLLTWQRSGARP